MHSLFLDERYPSGTRTGEIIFAGVAVPSARLDTLLQAVGCPYHAMSLTEINATLERIGAFAVVSRAALPTAMVAPGITDSTDDICRMSRRDNFWSLCAVFTVGHVIRGLYQLGSTVAAVNIYYDPKSLKAAHTKAMMQTLREALVKEARRFSLERQSSLMANLEVQHIEAIHKPSASNSPTPLQAGTWLADQLCARSQQLDAVSWSRIASIDMTDVVKRTLQQWDGKSFYAD